MIRWYPTQWPPVQTCAVSAWARTTNLAHVLNMSVNCLGAWHGSGRTTNLAHLLNMSVIPPTRGKLEWATFLANMSVTLLGEDDQFSTFSKYER